MFDFLKSALLIIDVQNDFCPAGALAVPGGDEVIAPLNRLAEQVAQTGGKVIATADWHPPDHASFAASHPGMKPGDPFQGTILWESHCIQGSPGAGFPDKLLMNSVHCILRKGFRRNLDSYSAFFENDRKTPTGLEGFLKTLGITTLFLGGLATDYCVLYSALDAARLGYQTILLTDAVRGVGYPPGSVERAFETMHAAGVGFKTSEEIL